MVCGAARSGTTMLDLMLGSVDSAVSVGEIFAYFRPYLRKHLQPVCSCGAPDCAYWRGLLSVPEHKFHTRLLEEKPDVRVIVDSSKSLRWVLDSNTWAADEGLAVRNVVLWKNPIDLSYSHWRRGQSISKYRREFVVYYGRFLDLGLPFVSLNYSALVENPEATLRLLCSRLGIQFNDACVKFWDKQHHHFYGSAGTRKQVGNLDAAIIAETNYPDEFLALYAQEKEWMQSDKEFMAIMRTLESRDISKGLGRTEEPGRPSGLSNPPGTTVTHLKRKSAAIWRAGEPASRHKKTAPVVPRGSQTECGSSEKATRWVAF